MTAAASPATVLFVQPTSEVGGSDLALLRLVMGLDKTKVRSIVALPAPGPLVSRIESHGGTVRFVPMPPLRGTLNPWTQGRFRRPRLARESMPSPNWICWSCEMAGARVTCLAGLTSAFLMVTLSPMETPAFLRVRLSTWMMPLPSSPGCDRHTTAAVVLWPLISMMSPGLKFSSTRVWPSSRARP